LRARLGEHAIKRIASSADYQPERAHIAERVRIDVEPTVPELPTTLAPRPLWLLKQPRKLRSGAIVRPERGPEVIHYGWWDGAMVEREYFHARTRRGALAWIYRDPHHANQLHVHGLFG